MGLWVSPLILYSKLTWNDGMPGRSLKFHELNQSIGYI